MKRTSSGSIMVMPASALPFRQQWRSLMNEMPEGSVLVVVPSCETTLKQSMRKITALLRSTGRRVDAIPFDHLHRGDI